jgi:hypothetical protein
LHSGLEDECSLCLLTSGCLATILVFSSDAVFFALQGLGPPVVATGRQEPGMYHLHCCKVNREHPVLPAGAESFAAFQSEMKVLLRECIARDSPPPADDMSIGAQLWRVYHAQVRCKDMYSTWLFKAEAWWYARQMHCAAGFMDLLVSWEGFDSCM